MNDRRIYTDTLRIFTVIDALFLSTNLLPRAKTALILSKRARR